MNINKAVALIVSIFILTSCSDIVEPDGKWDDIIKLSTKNVDFTAKTDSVLITTKGNWWWIDGIIFEDSTYSYYQQDDINLESDSYLIKEKDFIVERQNKNTLFVKIYGNNTGNKRIMYISLEAGDYFDHVTINQDAN